MSGCILHHSHVTIWKKLMWFIHPEMFFWCFWDWSIFICGFRGPTHLNHRLQLWAPGRIPFSAFASVYLPVCVWVICLSTGWAESSSLGGLYIGLVVHTVPVRAFKEDQLSPGCVTNDLMPTLQIMLVSLSHVSTYQLHLKKQSCQLDSTTYRSNDVFPTCLEGRVRLGYSFDCNLQLHSRCH